VLRRLAFALPLLALPLTAGAQEQTAMDFVKSIYEPYRQANFKGQPYDQPKRFFTPDLAAAIERDFEEAKKRNEVPTLDGDPFLDAQDWKVETIAYAVSQGVDKTKASASVAFVNLGEPKGVVLSLLHTTQGWRISEIIAPSGSLRALYKLK
jgi:hypothetical protein